MQNFGAAFLEVQRVIKNPPLDSRNPHFGSDFSSLNAHIDTIIPVANRFNIAVVQEPCALDNGQPALRTRLIHSETGEFIESTMPLILAKNDPQGQGSAITYARRYALASIFGVTGEKDDDGNSSRAGTPVPQGTASDAAVSRRETPVPAAASAADIVGKAQAAAEANRTTPTDGGDPSSVTVHFGKNQGRTLGDLSKKQVEWYASTWEPNPKFASDEDRRLKLAAQLLAGLEPTVATVAGFSGADAPDPFSEIPF